MIGVDFWQGRYDASNTPWDLGGPSPHFVELLKQPPAFLKPGNMVVFGAGRGHDAALFAQHGFDVLGLDYAPGAVQAASQLYGSVARFEQANIFDLVDPASPKAGTFDYLLEHTCFCAILPQERSAYVQAAGNLLKPGGYLIGIFWEHGETDGPPFSTTEADLRRAFEPIFDVVDIQAKSPAADRSGTERLVILRRKA